MLSDGTIECWGVSDYGVLGSGAGDATLLPVSVSGISNAAAIAAGSLHMCALLTTGAVQCWGLNDKGQLGDGTTQTSFVPVTVGGF